MIKKEKKSLSMREKGHQKCAHIYIAANIYAYKERRGRNSRLSTSA